MLPTPCAAMTPNSASWPRSELIVCVRWRTSSARVRNNMASGLRFFRLHRHKPHGRALRRLDNRGRVIAVILLALEKRFDIDRWDQLARVAKSDDLPTPVMRTAARPPSQSGTEALRREMQGTSPAKAFAEDRLAFCRRPMELETPLRNVDADNGNLVHGCSSVDRTHPSCVPSWRL